MTSFNRKLRRTSSKKIAKHFKKNMNEIVKNAVQKKMESFNKLPGECNICEKDFDKTDREQAFTWKLHISDEKEIYNLFCPECYDEQHHEEVERNLGDE